MLKWNSDTELWLRDHESPLTTRGNHLASERVLIERDGEVVGVLLSYRLGRSTTLVATIGKVIHIWLPEGKYAKTFVIDFSEYAKAALLDGWSKAHLGKPVLARDSLIVSQDDEGNIVAVDTKRFLGSRIVPDVYDFDGIVEALTL